MALIRERRLFQLQVKQKGECRENSELGKKKDKYAHLELLYEPVRIFSVGMKIFCYEFGWGGGQGERGRDQNM